jgi:hypothetical protein
VDGDVDVEVDIRTTSRPPDAECGREEREEMKSAVEVGIYG